MLYRITLLGNREQTDVTTMGVAGHHCGDEDAKSTQKGPKPELMWP